MAKVVVDMAMSLDGFIAGLNDDDKGLHRFFFAPSETTAAIIQAGIKATGAIIMGKRTYDIGAQQNGFVDNPYEVPTFVLSHSVPAQRASGTEDFVFVDDGLESALQQAQAVAGARAVVIGGGAQIARQYLQAGLVDEIQLYLIPILIGTGIRLFDDPNGKTIDLENVRTLTTPDVTHLTFRVIR